MFGSDKELNKWLAHLIKIHPKEISLGLHRIRRVAERLNLSIKNDQVRLKSKVIVVAGTNGKGSVCAILEKILIEAGYSNSIYTSPHILKFEERLRINGKVCTSGEWINAFEMVERARLLTPIEKLTFFESSTLAAFLIVQSKKPEIAIFEVGLGGRLDAVNLLANDCSIITSISLDHQIFLGTRRGQIGWEKAHIARSDTPIIIGDNNPPKELMDFVNKIGAKISRFGVDFDFKANSGQWDWISGKKNRLGLAYPSLRGVHQLVNASVALATLEKISDNFPVSQGDVRKGLATVELPARFQVLPGRPTVILDVAHNPEAAKMLSQNLDKIGFYPKTIAVVGILADKDATEIFRKVYKKIDSWYFVTLNDDSMSSRIRTAHSLSKSLLLLDPSAEFKCFNNPTEAFNAASESVSPNDRIVVFGSFITVAEVWIQAHRLGKLQISNYSE